MRSLIPSECDEACEQSRTIGCGAGGAKGGNREECGSAQHAPGTGPGKCVPCAGPHTASRRAKKEGEVHRALPPHKPRDDRSEERRVGKEWRSRSASNHSKIRRWRHVTWYEKRAI